MSAQIDSLIEEIKSEADLMRRVKLLQELVKRDDVKVKDVADSLGFKPSYICHLIRLNRLPEAVVDGYYSSLISLSHLFIISRVKDKEKMMNVYEKVLAESLTVKKTEEHVRDVLYAVDSRGDYLSSLEKENIIGKITNLRKNLKLKIIQTRIKSKIILEFKGDLENTGKELRSFLKNLEVWQKISLK